MKRTMVIILASLVITGLAILPGFNKRIYGAYLEVDPPSFGGGGYYMEGMRLFEIGDTKIEFDGFLGLGLGAAYVNYGYDVYYTSYFELSPAVRGSLMVYKRDLTFDVAGYKMMPSVRVDTGIQFSIGSIAGWGGTYSGSWVTYIEPYPYINLMFRKPEWNNWISIYLWPVPLIVGLDLISL